MRLEEGGKHRIVENIGNKEMELGEIFVGDKWCKNGVAWILKTTVLILIAQLELKYPLHLWSGIALFSILIYGYKMWPGIWLGTFWVTIGNGFSTEVAGGVASATTLGSFVGAYLVNNLIGVQNSFNKVRNIFSFLFYGLIGSLITASFGTLSMKVGHVPNQSIFTWTSLWIGEVTGIIFMTPFLYWWNTRPHPKLTLSRAVEFFVFILMLLVLCYFIFSGPLVYMGERFFSFKYLLLPFLVWSVYRFTPRELAFTLTTIASIATCNGPEINNTTISVQVFVSVITVMTLIMSTLVRELHQISKELARIESMNLLGEVAAGIAHEIRNPMTTVRGFLQLLGDRQTNAQEKEYYMLMMDELDRANTIISEFLAIGKTKHITLEKQNLNNIIRTIAPLIEANALQLGIKVRLNLNDIPNLYLNGKEIRQLLFNLCRNGIEAMVSGSTLDIKTYLRGKEVVLMVHDQGNGIPPELLPKLGTPFFTTKEQGTGLGLAVCYNIASSHNACIDVESCPKGTTFSVKFAIG